jgi:hypothetical protein
VIIANYRYEIDENNAISIWDVENPNEFNKPFFFQPTWPDNTPWASKEEAEQWAVDKINELLKPLVAIED